MTRSVATLALAILLGLVCGNVAWSQQKNVPSPAIIEQQVQDLLSKPPFATKRESYTYRYRLKDGDKSSRDFGFSWFDWLVERLGWLDGLASVSVWLIEVLFWFIFIAIVILILFYCKRWWPYRSARRPALTAPSPGVMFGQDVLSEPLPEDIVGEASALRLQGDIRGCLSVLYRGALLHIILSRQIPLPGSATEEDCLREVLSVETPQRARYFQSLTRYWQSTAYAAREPQDAQLELLVNGWRQYFGSPT